MKKWLAVAFIAGALASCGADDSSLSVGQTTALDREQVEVSRLKGGGCFNVYLMRYRGDEYLVVRSGQGLAMQRVAP